MWFRFLMSRRGRQRRRRVLGNLFRCGLVLVAGAVLISLLFGSLPRRAGQVREQGIRRSVPLPVYLPTWPMTRLRLIEWWPSTLTYPHDHSQTCLRMGAFHADLPMPPGLFLAMVLSAVLVLARRCWPWERRRLVLLATAMLLFYWMTLTVFLLTLEGTERIPPLGWSFKATDWLEFACLMILSVSYSAFLFRELMCAIKNRPSVFSRNAAHLLIGPPAGAEDA